MSWGWGATIPVSSVTLLLFGQKWRISASGIVINNPKIIDLLYNKFYGGPQKDAVGIFNYNPIRTYSTLVPKQYTFNTTKGSPQIQYLATFF